MSVARVKVLDHVGCGSVAFKVYNLVNMNLVLHKKQKTLEQ